MTDLQRAISDLSATRIGRTQYAYVGMDEGPSTVYVVDSDDLRDYGCRLRRGERDAYSLWCSATIAERMPRAEAQRRGLI